MQVIQILIIFIILQFSYCKARPNNIPKEAQQEENEYFLFDNLDGKNRYRSWDSNGELRYESLGVGDEEYVRSYLNGEVIAEGYRKELDNPKIKPKPKNIPEKATWNRMMKAWEFGIISDTKKDGVWKLWYESGVPFGFINYKQGILNGETRQYGEGTSLLEEIILFIDNENKGIKRYFPEKEYSKLPDLLKEGLDPLSSDELLLKEFFDEIPIGAENYKPLKRKSKLTK
jgi:hypothetical protein